jgi:hypothetical protein
MVSHFRVFGCPCIGKKWTISVDGKPEDNRKGTQRGIREINLGFSPTQKGLLLFMSPLQGTLSYLEMPFVMKPLHALWLRLGDHFMML